jgi:hypothetical protein
MRVFSAPSPQDPAVIKAANLSDTVIRARLALALGVSSLLLSGCAVVAVVDVAASAVVGVAGLAVDAAVGTARIGGQLIGAGADAALDSDEDE